MNVDTDQNQEISTKQLGWYDRWYKLFLILPILLLIISIVYLFNFYSVNGDFVLKDISLSGGTTITLIGNIDNTLLESALKEDFPDVYTRKITDISTGEAIAVLVDSSAKSEDLQSAIESFIGYPLNSENSSIEFTGSTLSNSFYRQLIIAILISFLLMSGVVFFLFRSLVPSIAMIFAAFADIIFALVLVNITGLRISAAGIAAFLMLIGYSVDTNILLTSRVLRNREGKINDRILSAFKTGIFMTLTALVALLPALLIVTGIPDSFKQIFLIAVFGLFGDIINTWMVNAGILKIYAKRKGII